MPVSFKELKKNDRVVLLPKLKRFALEEALAQQRGERSRKDPVIEDAKASIECFTNRIEEFNHGTIEDDGIRMFHPSSIGSCLRAMWLDAYKAPKNESLKSRGVDEYLREHLIFEVGTYFHVLFQNLCLRAGVLKGREIAIQDTKLRILGHMDGLVSIDGKDYALEIKTAGSYTFNQVMSTNLPNHAHISQVTLYMGALGLDDAIIIYYDKDKSRLKEFDVKFDKALFDRLLKRRINYFFENIEAMTLPAKEGSSVNEYPCRFCSLSDICFSTKGIANFMASIQPLEKKAKNATGIKKSKLTKSKTTKVC